MQGLRHNHRTHTREDPLYAEAQLRGQLQHIATHFPLQQQKYANKHTAEALRRNISLGS
jgi:hypothetical protein